LHKSLLISTLLLCRPLILKYLHRQRWILRLPLTMLSFLASRIAPQRRSSILRLMCWHFVLQSRKRMRAHLHKKIPRQRLTPIER
jgi:hypothetical protein